MLAVLRDRRESYTSGTLGAFFFRRSHLLSTPDETTEQPPLSTDPLIGQLVGGKYRVIRWLAEGGMARIYKAEQEPLGRIVALKALTAQPNVDAGARFEDRFFLEASTCAKLKHPNTVTLFDYGHHARTDTFYMIMELVDGRSLKAALKEVGAFHPVRALSIAIEICRSLQEAHQHGIVHRDLKPSNVMLTDTIEGEQVKVLDFGIAKVLQGNSQSITMEDRIVGSPRYMAPEQINQSDIDGRTDLYAVGVLLFEMITGRPPFSGRTAIQTLMKHVNEPPPRMSSYVPMHQVIPTDLDDLVASCMSKDPNERPKTAGALKEQLRGLLAEFAGATTMGSATESVVRHALRSQDSSADPLQPTLDRPATQESTLTRSTPILVGLGGVAGAGVIGAFGLIVFAILWAVYGSNGAEETPAVVVEPEPVEAPAPAPAPVAPPVLRIVSEPAGAEVFEGETSLGKTPLELPVEAGAELVFELRLDGFQPTMVEPGAISEDTEVTAEMRAKPRPKASPKPKPDDDLDIIDRR